MVVVVCFDCRWLRHILGAANPWLGPGRRVVRGTELGGMPRGGSVGVSHVGPARARVLGMGEERGWWQKPQQCLCPCVPVLFTVGHAGGRRRGRVSPLGCREVALAQSVSQGSCASPGIPLAVPAGVCDSWAPCGLIPSSCSSSAQGWLGQRD